MQALIGQKKVQSQRFLENGKRIPVTLIDVKDNTVLAVRSNDKHNYQAVQLGFSIKKNAKKAELGHAKGAKLEKAPKFLKEVGLAEDAELPEIGTVLNPSEVFAPGDIVDVKGTSKGKGFQGGVKRYNFRGGPKTHGQSDRHRAPGSVGQGTTPGRVYKGKRMAGNMGNDNITVRNLEVVDVTNDGVLVIKGLVPGVINSLIVIEKVGEDKKFVPLQKTPEQLEAEEKQRLAEEAAAKEAEEKAKAEAEAAVSQAPAEESSENAETEKAEATEEVKAEGSVEAETKEAPAEASDSENKEEVKEGEENGDK
jgi:large subunit ribosomal protein L3